jgi:NAD(P)H-hydrate epimerase
MREADRRCIEEIGIPGPVLMNNAGAAVFREIDRGPVGIMCGKGNNGGDGFVVARLALLAGFGPRVVLAADPDEIRGDAATFMRAYQRLGGPMISVKTEDAVRAAAAGLSDCAVLVDALLGTGITGEVRGVMRAAIEAWPPVHTIAVDLPSGLNADTGEPSGCCVRADVTVTFQFAKRGFEAPTAQPYIGRLKVVDIGIPELCADDEAWNRLCAAIRGNAWPRSG